MGSGWDADGVQMGCRWGADKMWMGCRWNGMGRYDMKGYLLHLDSQMQGGVPGYIAEKFPQRSIAIFNMLEFVHFVPSRHEFENHSKTFHTAVTTGPHTPGPTAVLGTDSGSR